MADETSGDADAHVKLKELRCRRTGQMYTVEKHVECPYCSGDAATIERDGKYANFCEFEPGKDAVHFGFPEGSARNRKG